MQILIVLLTLFLQKQICSGNVENSCTGTEPCTCKTTRYSKLDIDCRRKGLSVSKICGLCAKVKHVRSLDVSDNGLNTLPVACFKMCTEMEELIVESNNITDITKEAFTGLVNLVVLNLNNNSLIKHGKISDPGLFEPLKSLEILRIQRNVNVMTQSENSTYLSNVANNTLRNLQKLYLDGVPAGSFGSNFIYFRNLITISFSGAASYCHMFNLHNTTFKNVPYTQTLDLSFCNVTSVDAGTFEPLRDLQLLNLSYNMALGFPSLRNVSYGFRESSNIKVLDYTKVYKTFGLTTQLNRCDVWYLQNTSLKEIRLNSNRLSSIELNALHLWPRSLETAIVEDNRLTFGPYALQLGCLTNLVRLELNMQDLAHPMTAFNDELDIVENKIDSSGGCPVQRKSLKPGCRLGKHKPLKLLEFTFPAGLRSIGYSNSNLRYEPANVSFPLPLRNKVESFDLSKNVIYTWADPLVTFDYLKHLNLSNNFCTNITGKFFQNFRNLETLDASFNKLGPSLEKDMNGSIFNIVTGLKSLNISGNWIEKLPPNVFIYLCSLEYLDLSFNQLEKVNFEFQHMQNLSTLLLRQNKISTLPLDLLEHMGNFAKTVGKNVTIDLSDNMIDAQDCENMDFLSWVIQHPKYFANINAYTFYRSHSKALTYQQLKHSLSHFKKQCKTYTGIVVISSLFIMASISVTIGGIMYRYRWRLRYFYYMTKARYGGYVPVRTSDTDKTYQYDVFISYATENDQFVTGEMYNQLKEAGLSLCLHQKDFLPGNYIAENIVQAVRNSKMTLIVLSPAFLESKWCIYEFNMARMESIYSRDGDNVVYVVMYESVDITLLSPEMRECLESESYIAFPHNEEEHSYFWQILKQALSR